MRIILVGRLPWMSLAGVFLICSVLPTKATPGVRMVPAQEKAMDIAGLAWIAGDWEINTPDKYVDEHWTVPAGGMMLGMGRTIAAGKTKFFEYLRIETRADGIYYVAHPLARPGIDFRLARMTSNEAVFENPGHSDHIKRIIYRKESEDVLTGRVEGADNGKPFAQDFRYHRMSAR